MGTKKINQFDVDETVLTIDHENARNPHGTTASDVGAIPITGGNLTGGDLGLSNGYGHLVYGNRQMALRSYNNMNDVNEGRWLSIINSANGTPLKDSVAMCDVSGGTQKWYNIYGTHNKPTASDVGAIPSRMIVTNSSTSSNTGRYIRIARATMSSTYQACLAVLSFLPAETSEFAGLLSIYIRTSSSISAVTCQMHWLSFWGSNYADSIVAEKVSDGVYDIYMKATLPYQRESISVIHSLTDGAAKFELASGTEAWKDTVNATFTSEDGNYLPLSGGTLTKDLLIKFPSSTATSHFINYGDSTYMRVSDGTQNNYADIVVGLSEAVRYTKNVNGSYNSYSIFGQHNKPTVKYNGNGSTTARSVSIGGVGSVLYVQGSVTCALVTYFGALCWSPTNSKMQTMNAGEVNFRSGVLNMNTSADFFNTNAIEYGCVLL